MFFIIKMLLKLKKSTCGDLKLQGDVISQRKNDPNMFFLSGRNKIQITSIYQHQKYLSVKVIITVLLMCTS